ncbi:hypothetical protein [Ferruginivarius sediminum]|nr:hypothetical protein [Ferruginivarius sediminum]
MNREALFYQRALNQRVNVSDLNPQRAYQAVLYMEQAKLLADTLEIDGFPDIQIPENPREADIEEIRENLFQVERFMIKMYNRNIFDLDNSLRNQFVSLDESWKQKVSSYIANIRKHVDAAEVDEALKERIFAKLNQLQNEVDRNRTRVASASEALTTMTEAVGQSAKNLRPAVALMERVTGSISKLWRTGEEREKQPQLPAPQELGLPDNGEDEEAAE